MRRFSLLRTCTICFAFLVLCFPTKAEDVVGEIFIDQIRYLLVEDAGNGPEAWIDKFSPWDWYGDHWDGVLSPPPVLSGDIVLPDTVYQNGIAYPVRVITGGTPYMGSGPIFYDQTGITSIKLPEPLMKIGEYAFAGCTGLSEIKIPDNVEYIGGYAFANTGITRMVIPNKVTLLRGWGESEGHLLEGCHLTKLMIENGEEPLASVTQWQEMDLFGCMIDTLYLGRNIGNAYLPSGIKEITIGKSFNQKLALNINYGLPESEIAKSFGNRSDGFAPIEKVKFQCDTIKDWFCYATAQEDGSDFIELVENIEICDGVKVIGENAFSEAYTMTSVDLPGSIVSLEPGCFAECYSLQSISLPEGVTKIGRNAFYGCSSLTEVNLPESLLSLGNYTFALCTSLTKIDIPDKVTTVYHCWDGCENLTTIILGRSVNDVSYSDTYNYHNCKKIAYVEFHCDSVGAWFSNNKGTITHAVFGNEVLNIGKQAFEDHYALKHATFGNKLRVIDDYAFNRCSGLENVALPNSVKYIGYMAFGFCSHLTSIPIGGGAVADNAYQGCTNVTSVNLNYVDTIGQEAFAECSRMKSLVLGSGTKLLKEKAFYGCDSLITVICKAVIPPAMEAKNCFTCYSDAILYVPSMSVNAYQESNWWNCFSEIVGMDFADTPTDLNGDGNVDISDVTLLIDTLLSGTDDEDVASMDVDGDGKITVADVTQLIDILLRGY